MSGRRTRGIGRTAMVIAAAGGLLVSQLSGVALAATGGPDGGGYTYSDNTGSPAGQFPSIANTGTDIGNHGDEVMTAVDLPFPVSFYDDANVTSVNVNSNGNVQFDTDESQYSATDLPTSNFSTVMLPFWADLVTDGADDGIFTETFGDAPNRQFYIEWDAHTYSPDPAGGAPEVFQLILTENSQQIEFRYLNVSTAGVSYVAGIQGSEGFDGKDLQYNTGGSQVQNHLAVYFTRVPPTSATTLSVFPDGGSTYGQAVTLTAHVARTDGGTANPTGTVTFSDNGTALGTVTLGSSGQAVLTTRRLAAGGNLISASYSGDANTTASSGSIPDFQVHAAVTNTSINLPNGATITYGQPVTATVEALQPGGLTPTGVVFWYDDPSGTVVAQSTLVKGRARLGWDVLTPGQHQLTAYYPGATGYRGSNSASIDVTIVRAPVTVTLVSSANPATAGSKVRFVATVRPEYPGVHATGDIVFYKNGSPVRRVPLNAAGQAGTTFPAGNYTVFAAYQGNGNYLPNDSATINQTQG